MLVTISGGSGGHSGFLSDVAIVLCCQNTDNAIVINDIWLLMMIRFCGQTPEVHRFSFSHHGFTRSRDRSTNKCIATTIEVKGDEYSDEEDDEGESEYFY